MKEKEASYSLRLDRHLLDKIQYISKYEDRSANKQIQVLIKRCIAEFEKAHGEITKDLISEMYGNKKV